MPTKGNEIRVATIHRYKGLESPVVVLAEIDSRIDEADLASLLYVGATRARSHLVVVASDRIDDHMRIADLKPGWDVVTNDGHRLGRIKDVGQHFIVVPGGFLAGMLYVPSSAIANVEHETVHLNVAQGEVGAMGWQQPPRLADDLQSASDRDAHRDI